MQLRLLRRTQVCLDSNMPRRFSSHLAKYGIVEDRATLGSFSALRALGWSLSDLHRYRRASSSAFASSGQQLTTAGTSYQPNCCRTILMDVQPLYFPMGNTKAASIYSNLPGERRDKGRLHNTWACIWSIKAKVKLWKQGIHTI